MSDLTPGARPLRLVVVSAGTSVPSSTRMLADRLATGTLEALAELGHQGQVEVIEVRDLAHDIVDAALTHFPGDRLRAAVEQLQAADGVIAVSPTYNLSYSGLFKAFWDVGEPASMTGVPVLLGATGGTARHSLAIDYAMRPLFGYLKAEIAPTSVFAASEDFGAVASPGAGAAGEESLAGRTRRAGTELAQLMVRFAGLSAGSVTPTRRTSDGSIDQTGRQTDEFADFVPMSQLLG